MLNSVVVDAACFRSAAHFKSRTFVHVLKVLVELPLSCFVVDLLLHDVAPVLDVVSDGHLLQAALRVPQRPPRLLDLQPPYITRKLRRGSGE